ncbi:MAG: HAD family hydrolase [Candidatus Nanopelagicales bacterium]
MHQLPAAVLCDMDGTLVESEEYWIEVEVELARADGGHWTAADGISLIGSAIPYSASVLRTQGGVLGTDQQIAERLVQGVARRMRERGVIWRPGAREFLESVHAAGVPLALVTMSYRDLAETVAEALPAGTFQTIVAGDAVKHGKPHPEPYLTAAARIGVDTSQCIGIEDSPTGLASVEAAGVRAIGIPCLVEIPAAEGRSRVRSLTELGLEQLAAIADGQVIDRL